MASSNRQAAGPIELPAGVRLPGSSGTACSQGWLTGSLRPSPCLLAGILAGGLSIAVSELVGYLPSGHQLNDPLQLALAAGALLRGFRYFNWVSFATSISVGLALGGGGWFALRVLSRRRGVRVTAGESTQAARAAAVISTLPVLIREVDALQVLLWYGLATWLSTLLAGFGAQALSRFR